MEGQAAIGTEAYALHGFAAGRVAVRRRGRATPAITVILLELETRNRAPDHVHGGFGQLGKECARAAKAELGWQIEIGQRGCCVPDLVPGLPHEDRRATKTKRGFA